LELLPEGLNFAVFCCAARDIFRVSKGWWKPAPGWYRVRVKEALTVFPDSLSLLWSLPAALHHHAPDVQAAARSFPP